MNNVNKYRVWLLLFAVTANMYMTMSAMVQQNTGNTGSSQKEEKEEEEKKESSSFCNSAGDFAYGAADSIMNMVAGVPESDRLVQMYKKHRHGEKYKQIYRLGEEIVFEKTEYNTTLERVTTLCKYDTGEILDKRYVCSYTDDERKNLIQSTVRGGSALRSKKGMRGLLMYDTILYQGIAGTDGVLPTPTNYSDDVLVTDESGMPLMYDGALVFENTVNGDIRLYVNADRKRLDLSDNHVRNLPTIYNTERCPNMAVGGVLAGTGVTLVGVGALVWQFAKLGRKKMSGASDNDKIIDNKIVLDTASEKEKQVAEESVQQDVRESTTEATMPAEEPVKDTVTIESVTQKTQSDVTEQISKTSSGRKEVKGRVIYVKIPSLARQSSK